MPPTLSTISSCACLLLYPPFSHSPSRSFCCSRFPPSSPLLMPVWLLKALTTPSNAGSGVAWALLKIPRRGKGGRRPLFFTTFLHLNTLLNVNHPFFPLFSLSLSISTSCGLSPCLLMLCCSLALPPFSCLPVSLFALHCFSFLPSPLPCRTVTMS